MGKYFFWKFMNNCGTIDDFFKSFRGIIKKVQNYTLILPCSIPKDYEKLHSCKFSYPEAS